MAKISETAPGIFNPNFSTMTNLYSLGLQNMINAADPIKEAMDANYTTRQDSAKGKLAQFIMQQAPMDFYTNVEAQNSFMPTLQQFMVDNNLYTEGVTADTVATKLQDALTDKTTQVKNQTEAQNLADTRAFNKIMNNEFSKDTPDAQNVYAEAADRGLGVNAGKTIAEISGNAIQNENAYNTDKLELQKALTDLEFQIKLFENVGATNTAEFKALTEEQNRISSLLGKVGETSGKLQAPTSIRYTEPNVGAISGNGKKYLPYINKAAKTNNVDPALLFAMARAESAFNPNARSPVGAQGLIQLMPDTAKRFGVKDAFNPAENTMGAAKYVSWLSKRFDGNLDKILAGYNAGEGNVDKYGGIPPFKETQEYVKKVKKYYNEYQQLLGTGTNLNAPVQGSDDDSQLTAALSALDNPEQINTPYANNVPVTATGGQPIGLNLNGSKVLQQQYLDGLTSISEQAEAIKNLETSDVFANPKGYGNGLFSAPRLVIPGRPTGRLPVLSDAIEKTAKSKNNYIDKTTQNKLDIINNGRQQKTQMYNKASNQLDEFMANYTGPQDVDVSNFNIPNDFILKRLKDLGMSKEQFNSAPYDLQHSVLSNIINDYSTYNKDIEKKAEIIKETGSLGVDKLSTGVTKPSFNEAWDRAISKKHGKDVLNEKGILGTVFNQLPNKLAIGRTSDTARAENKKHLSKVVSKELSTIFNNKLLATKYANLTQEDLNKIPEVFFDAYKEEALLAGHSTLDDYEGDINKFINVSTMRNTLIRILDELNSKRQKSLKPIQKDANLSDPNKTSSNLLLKSIKEANK